MSRRIATPGIRVIVPMLIVASVVCSGAGVLTAGLRSGGIRGQTELDDQIGVLTQAFIRRSLTKRWRVESAAGYGRLIGPTYQTDVAMAEARILFDPTVLLTISGTPLVREPWEPYVYGGIGILRYDLSQEPPNRTPDAQSIGWGMTAPVGLGFSYPLPLAGHLDLSGGFTYTMRDDINGAILVKGNDVFWTVSIGLSIEFGSQQQTETPALSTSPNLTLDRDSDGLIDVDETTIHFTNPLMADSDGDGLDDYEEIVTHHTNPNRLDTDGGGVYDAEEITYGTDPLRMDDDVAAATSMISSKADGASQSASAVVFFPYGGTTLNLKARADLDRVAKLLGVDKDLVLELRGYSDNTGREEANLRLSRMRAEIVKDYLVAKGIAVWRLSVQAMGDADPVASNMTEEERRQNRRVEIIPVGST